MAHLVPTIRSLPHAMLRAKFQWVMAKVERRGIPLDLPLLTRIRRRWTDIRTDLVRELDRFGIYEIVDGVAHWRKARFAEFIEHNRMSWPRLESGVLDEADETFREMEGRYPFIGPLRELRYSLSKLRLNALAVGNDGRNRTPLWAFGTKTARNAPSASAYVFGPAKWIRLNVPPPPGQALIHRDYCQQEVRIAAVLSGDAELLAACESGDVYLGIARQLGFLRDSMSGLSAHCSKRSCSVSSTVWARNRWLCALASRFTRLPRSLPACAPVSVSSKLLGSEYSTTPASILN
jgi:DNA polymerase-1